MLLALAIAALVALTGIVLALVSHARELDSIIDRLAPVDAPAVVPSSNTPRLIGVNPAEADTVEL